MAMLDLIAKPMENCLAPRSMNGIFTKTIKADKLTGVRSSNKRDIPMAPPSKKPFGRRKPFNPMLAMQIPMEIKRKSFQVFQEVNLEIILGLSVKLF
jgi:hypothetical protein